MSFVVEDLPLFDLTLVHLELVLANALLTDHLFDPVFKLGADLTHFPVIGDTRVVFLVASHKEGLVIILIVQVPMGWGKVTSHQSSALGRSFEIRPHLSNHLVGVRS